MVITLIGKGSMRKIFKKQSLYSINSLSNKEFNNSGWKLFIIFGTLRLKLMNHKFDVR